MKKIIASLTFIIALNCLAIEGVIIVLEAPLFSRPDTTSRIVQYVRKNELLMIHNRHAPPLMYQIYDEKILKDLDHSAEKFFTTRDRSGNKAYALKEHVKLIYKDAREFYDRSLLTHDPTDYRLAEPIPENYPLQRNERYKATVSIGLGSSGQSSYSYPTTIDSEDYGIKKLVSISYAKKVGSDISNRFYFGAEIAYQQESSNFKLDNFTSAVENTWQLGIGPYMSYLAFKNPRFQLQIYGGISYNIARSNVSITHVTVGYPLMRRFSGSLFKGRIGLRVTHRFLPKIDLTLSTQLDVNLPYSLESSDFKKAPELWSSNDNISHSSIVSMGALLGILAYY